MEFLIINKKEILLNAESKKRETEIRKIILRLIDSIKQIQVELE